MTLILYWLRCLGRMWCYYVKDGTSFLPISFWIIEVLNYGISSEANHFFLQWGFSSALCGKDEEVNIASLDLLEDLNQMKWIKWIHVANPNYFWVKNLLDFNSFLLHQPQGLSFGFSFVPYSGKHAKFLWS